MADRLLATLAARPIVLDAAMGTRLIARGLDLRDDDPALWNLTHPDEVRAVHALDVAAGADAVLTNTFGANAHWLARYSRADYAVEITMKAVELAREAVGPRRFVVGSIGPSWSAASADLVRDQARTLDAAGVDAILLETHTAPRALAAVKAIRPVSRLPILVGLAGIVAGEVLPALADAGVAAIGSNCDTLCAGRRVAALVRETVGLPGLSKPSGGLPGRKAVDPRSFAAAVPGLLTRGVRLFGGCCGTTEAHVAALRNALDAAAPARV